MCFILTLKSTYDNNGLLLWIIEDNERILKYRYRWVDADVEPTDDKLDINEMMNFRHPEQSKLSIKRLVTDLVDNVG